MAIERGREFGSQRSAHSYKYEVPLKEKVKDFCRATVAFFFSNVGVCGLMVGYTIMGAFLFQAIEGPTEAEQVLEIGALRNKTIQQLWEITMEYNTLYPKNWTDKVAIIVKNYQKEIIVVVNEGWDGSDSTSGPSKWSIEGAFLYSLTVITTIGYGHISPKTDVGKIMTIFYAIFGMPVFLLYMANMGDILAKCLKWSYSKVCICKKLRETRYDPSVAWRSAATTLGGPVGPNYISEAIHNSSEDIAQETAAVKAIPDFPQEEEVSIQSWASAASEKSDITSINIPLSVSLFIMLGLLFGGTRLFQEYEQWDMLTSFYFCFISLTTIGFGDYVPGSSVESVESGNKMTFIYCALYLLFGLAFLSMCFNLMQEQVVHRVTTCINVAKLLIRRTRQQVSDGQ